MSRTVIDLLQLPKDILLGLPYLTFHGNLELIIENHSGLINYSSKEISVLAKEKTIAVCGNQMIISEYSKDTLIIHGNIYEVRFVE